MKRVILMRHSIPERVDLPTEKLPLSEEGIRLILDKRENFFEINKCFSSPYRRAIETAMLISDSIEVIDNLHERIVGDAKEDFWYKQYSDYNYKSPGGESLNEVKKRMLQAMSQVLDKAIDGETILVVSHATAICSYLLNYCKLEVVDAASKSRRIVFNNKVILNGIINPADYFIIEYEGDSIDGIVFCGNDKWTI